MYSLQHPEKGLIEFSDKKRYLWIASILIPLTPLFVIWGYFETNSYWVLLSPLPIAYVLIPFLDFAVGADTTNPPEEIVPQLDDDPYYKNLLKVVIPLHFVVLIGSVWFIAQASLPWWVYGAFAFIVGNYSGFSINTAHEIGHKNSKSDRLWARISLAVSGYGHFCIEHNLGHHRDVSTPEDPASSRMGEGLYAFMWREIPGAARRGWSAERDRLSRKGFGFWSTENHILQSYALTLLVQGGLVAIFGWVVLPFLLIHNFFAWFQLTCANYIEHYGLLRAKNENGKYERCKPHHSWNANHIFSNLLLFQLERHSDHHANPARPYQSLRSFENLPELPAG
ncbi:MAG: alkane 1-monooxygenase, partial [Pseudomonadota bacterium]